MAKLQRMNAITWALTFMLYSVSITLCLIWKYAIEVNSVFFFVVDVLVVFFVTFAVLIKIIHTEISINQYKFYKGYYCTIVMIIFIVFTLFLTPRTIREPGPFIAIYLVLLSIGVVIFPGIYLYLAFKMTGKERKKALKIVVASILIFIGLVVQPQNIIAFSDVPNFKIISNIFLILAPISIVVALLIIFSSYRDTL